VTRDVDSPRDRYLRDVLRSIEHEARLTRQPGMPMSVATNILILDRFERGILSRDERDAIMRLAVSDPEGGDGRFYSDGTGV
jgi:hypothetical protein